MLHTGHNFTRHIPDTADSSAKALLSAVTKFNWSPSKTRKHIAAHIDHVKFGRDDYGFGYGPIELTTRDGAAI